MLPENLSSSENQEKGAKSNSPSTAGFVMERRRHHLKEAELDSNTTSSLKRFQKHISTSIKAGKKTGRQFTIARIAILEIGNLSESSEFGLAKSLDAHCKEHIVGQLRKSDRLFSNMLGEYLVLMPNTDLDICKKAVTRIAESLADSTFQKGPFTICPSSKASYVTWTQGSELSATELISSLGYGPPVEDQEEDSLETESNGIVKLFTGDFSGWFSRYELEPDFDTVKSVEDSELDLLNYVGRDSWISGRVVLMRVLYHPEGKLRISPETKHAILQFLRQVQSLGNATVVSSGLLDFHIHDNRIYLVNTVPEFVECDSGTMALESLVERKLHGVRPWGWSPQSAAFFAPLADQLATGETLGWQPAWRALYSKAWSADHLRNFMDEAGEDWMCGTEVIGNIIKAKTVKSRLSRENRQVEIRLFYDERGLDRYYGLLDLADKHGVIKKVANRYEINGKKVYAKEVYKNPEKYFTPELMQALDEVSVKEFTYGGE